MPLIPFTELLAEAERGNYALGYFESWNLESLMAVADAAKAVRSPVLLGFSGIYLPHEDRIAREPLTAYTAFGLDVIRQLDVPAALVFNESPHVRETLAAIDAGFSMVMFSDDSLGFNALIECVRQVVDAAHAVGVAVEGEAAALPGVAGELESLPRDRRLTDIQTALDFIKQTHVDAFAVNVGQLHLHGRQEVGLDLKHLAKLAQTLSLPLVLHGASSVKLDDLVEAIRLGIRKVNVGSRLKQSYFEALRLACAQVGNSYNPYEIIGSGLSSDVLVAGRLALQSTVEDWMHLLGSAGQA